jgi:hypothetical protein
LRRRNFWSVLLFVGLLAAVAAAGQAQWRTPGYWTEGGLNLSDEQLARIQEKRLAFQEKIMPLRMRWEKAHLALDSLSRKGAPQKDLDSAYEALHGVEMEMDKAYQAHRNEVRGLLDEEQQVLFDRYGGLGMGPGRAGGMSPRWGMRGGRGRGMGRGFFCPWYR